jgi:2-polyprenyl-3-methyl-5-hydroxy-6-metoxy-1,4-benzoquinol methylase
MSGSLETHYERAVSEGDGELYPELRVIDRAAHNRRVEVLGLIDLPDLTQATVLDYGVGSWGFGSVMEHLKICATPIGVDISKVAVAMSAEHSAGDPALAGKTVRYLTSTGYAMDIESDTVDVIFCGECIEHVEDTAAFLTEMHRILKPGGHAIFTTPNADPWVYRQMGMRWCVGFEHVALMNYKEFKASLTAFFDVKKIYGFNHSFLPGVDGHIDEALAHDWSKGCLDDPENATSLIGYVVKPLGAKSFPEQKIETLEGGAIKVVGEQIPTALQLFDGVDGMMLNPGSHFEVEVPQGYSRCNLILWSHNWSGHVEISTSDYSETIDLYGALAGCLRHTLHDVEGKTIRIVPTGAKNPRSHADQVILYRVVFAGEK